MIISQLDFYLKELFRKRTNLIAEFNPHYLHSRVLEDTVQDYSFYYDSLIGYGSNFLVMFVTLFVLYRNNSLIFLISLLFIPVYSLIYIFFHKRLWHLSLEISESGNKLYANRNAIYQRYLEIKARAVLDGEIQRNNKLSKNLLHLISESFIFNYSIYALRTLTGLGFKVLIFLIMASYVIKGELTIGVYLYLMQYVNTLLMSVDNLLQLSLALQKCFVAKTRLTEIETLPYANEGKNSVNKVRRILVKNFNFTYKDRNLYSEDINYVFETGNIYSITGANGVGKSTFINSIVGLYDIDSLKGEILYNELELKTLSKSNLRRKNLSLMMQYPSRLGKQVQEYLVDSDIELNDLTTLDGVWQSLFFGEHFDLHNYLEQDYDSLSGGEKQLLALYVCVKKDADVYILDEPLASLQQEFKQMVCSHLTSFAAKGKLVICVTHESLSDNSNTLMLK